MQNSFLGVTLSWRKKKLQENLSKLSVICHKLLGEKSQVEKKNS